MIAEGVENAEQEQFLAGAGCQQIQGFLGSPPLPAEEFAARFLEAYPASGSATCARP